LQSELVEEAFKICSGAIPSFPDDPIKALPDLLLKIKNARAACALKPAEIPEESKYPDIHSKYFFDLR